MPSLTDAFPDILAALAAHYGRGASTSPLPVREAFEALTLALLERSLDGKKATAVVEALRDDGLLEPQALAEADPAEIAGALEGAGLSAPRNAYLPLHRLARWLVDLHHGAADDLAGPDSSVSTGQLRDELLTVNGIGPATADALLLHGLGRPVYPLDRPTYRILARHGWIDLDAGYDDAREAVERLAPDDPATLAQLGAWFERLARDFCRAGAPKCERCPLRPWLPENGPVGADG